MPLNDVIEDVRLALKSNTLRTLLALAISALLQVCGLPALVGGESLQALLNGLDWLLIALAAYFRTRANGPIRFRRPKPARDIPPPPVQP